MVIPQCPHCGTYLPSFSVVHIRGKKRRMIYEFILKHPYCTMDRIVNYVYGDDPNGGPESASRSVHVLISNIRKIIRKHGLVIENHRGPGACYRIIPIKTTPAKPTRRTEGRANGPT